MPGLLKPPSLSAPPKTIREFEKSYDELLSHSIPSKLITHNERIGSKTTTFSEKVCLGLTGNNGGNVQGKDKGVEKGQSNNGNTEGKYKMQRGYSWKLSRPSLRKKKNRSGSDSDAILVLNNGRDHSQCNGGGVTRHVRLNIS